MNNTIVLEGRLTKDPELKDIGEGKVMLKFILAVPRGNANKETDFIPIVVFGKTAETMAKYKKQGDLISVSGSLRSSFFNDSNGINRRSLEVNGTRVNFLSSAKKKETSTSMDYEVREDYEVTNNNNTNNLGNEFYSEVDVTDKQVSDEELFGMKEPVFNW